MTRVEHLSEDVTLMLGDCREMAAGLSYDAVVSDPPYGIAYEKGTGGNGAQPKERRRDYGPIVGDSEPFDPSPWLSRPCILWGANHFAARLPHGRWMAWNKLGSMEPWDSFSDVEFAWQNTRGADRIFSLLWKGLAQGEKIGGGQRYHPTQKPIGLMTWCIEQLPDGCQTILDPYMGAGTTGLACVRLGRRFTGIEIEPRYFDIACRRISDELRRPRLQLEPVAKPVQEVMSL